MTARRAVILLAVSIGLLVAGVVAAGAGGGWR